MKLLSSKGLKGDFKDCQSPSLVDFNKAGSAAGHNTPVSREIERSVVAGELLYNAEVYGSLRKGGAVRFFSKDCVGLVAATFATTFAIESLTCAIEPMLTVNFGLKTRELAASKRLTTFPMTLCFFFGLLSDSYPILGLRRLGYLLIGLGTTVVSLLVLAALDGYVESLVDDTAKSGLAVAIILFATLASTGNALAYVCVHTRVMELSQREPLGMRGAIQANYLAFQYGVYILTDACATIIFSFTTHHYTALLLFALVIAASIPLIWKSWQEKCYSLSTPVYARAQIMWKIMQQKAAWSIMAFLCIFTFFTDIKFNGPAVVISVWAGASADNAFLQQVMYYGTMLVVVVLWRYYFMNRPWRSFYSMAIVLLVIPQMVVAICVTKDILRNRYFYRLMTVFTSASISINLLSNMVPLTEILQEGSEGAMVGLIVSVHSLVCTFVQTNTAGLFDGSNFYNIAEVAMDTPNARSDVLHAMLLNYGINTLAFFGILFLPRQKLYTQQLRSYGGYTKCTSAAIVAFAVILFVYSLTVTALTLIPSTSCMPIAGGQGC
ncbi:Transmembrane protein [Phytophthora cinnamomi]|uniref:Transmembrane protein n=1 Tax=Phytophthora cinnamomi TaxID=4785 RepID=UPI0035598DE5|nr:Transmembrane protein [Phytophthora cinnamomi]